MMEHWNTGLNKKFVDSLTLFHHSTIPLFQNYPLKFIKFWPFWRIPLTFACLREAPPCGTKAEILVFDIAFIEIVVCPFG
jgi:hypothetical protein